MSAIKIFDLNEYMNLHAVKKDASSSRGISKHLQFTDVWQQVKNHYDALYDSNKINIRDKESRLQTEYEAMIGQATAEKFIMDEIEAYLRENHLLNVSYPAFYPSLAAACFHEIYGFGSFAKWQVYPDSTDGIIQGKEIWFNINGEFVKQEETLRDEGHVWEIIRTLQLRLKGLRINEQHPEAEFDREDGTRIKVIVPPRSLKPTIIFRRFVIRSFSFREQAERGTIPYEDIPLYEALAKLHLNTIISGKVQSGKSTFLKTIYAARDARSVAVLIESSPESYLKRDFPQRLVHDFYSFDGNIHQVIRDALRTPHDYIIAQEVRGIEAEGAIAGTERGTRGLLMTYHITNPKNVPRQLAKHIIDELPARTEKNEVIRIAEQLDIGITMTTVNRNDKKITSVYEIIYDEQQDQAWINYFIQYDPETNSWSYNSNVSTSLKKRMREYSPELTEVFLGLLQEREAIAPLINETKVLCN